VIVSHDIKSVYVHAQKTGGSTCTLLLAEHAGVDVTEFGMGWQAAFHEHGMHGSIPRKKLTEFDDYLKWGFVRNPYDRWRSWWQAYGRGKTSGLTPLNITLRGVDRVGRFETYEQDVRAILGELGVHVPESLPHCNPPIRSLKLTAVDADWIWNRDRRDFEQFGYDQESWREYA